MEFKSKQEAAMRIQGIAEHMMKVGDFAEGRKVSLRAQKLYANLENLPLMLKVCDVHCAAERKLPSGEIDWCGILQVEQTADEATIEQRYMELASMLDASKNRYPGAEAAYKWITAAKTVLLRKYEQSASLCAGMESRDQPVPSHGFQGKTGDSGCQESQVIRNSKGDDPSQLHKAQDVATSPASNTRSAASPCRGDGSSEDVIVTISDNSDDVLLQDLIKCGKVNGGMKRKDRVSESQVLSRNEGTIKQSGGRLSDLADDAEDQEAVTEALGNCSLQRHSEPDLVARSDSNTGSIKTPMCYEYADSEFNDFDKDRQEGCFSKGQIWAIYADLDTMPRYYAQIRNVSTSGFNLQMTWLEPVSDNKNKGNRLPNCFPAVCGLFKHGESVSADQRSLFSHLVHSQKDSPNKTFKILPRKGETWALFKTWYEVRKSNKDAKLEYEIVEITSEYNEITGVRIAPLVKVDGFVSIFCQSAYDTVTTSRILPDQLSRFSHQVPSFKMSGKEKEGLPTSCFELDPAALPEGAQVGNKGPDEGFKTDKAVKIN